MNGRPIPEDVRQFILRFIPSVSHLEALLLLRREPAEVWRVPLVARRIYVSEQRAAKILTDLTECGLFVFEGDSDAYRYCPQTTTQSEIADRVSETHSENLLGVTKLIHEGAGQRVADASKFPKA